MFPSGDRYSVIRPDEVLPAPSPGLTMNLMEVTPMASYAHTTPGADVFSGLIDLDAHQDGDLLRLCSALAKTRTATVALEDAIERTPAVTLDGRRMKELTL
jgi:hypothetical protein